MNPTKTCSKCDISKPLDEFYNQKDCKNGKSPQCKDCVDERNKKYAKKHKEEKAEYDREYAKKHKKKRRKYMKKYNQEHRDEAREKAGQIAMSKNKSCSSYLGVFIGERLCKHIFKNVVMMPYGNPGFDIICNKGKKIDVKTSCIKLRKDRNPFWKFKIKRNTAADFFILVAFDNRTDLNTIHIWMIPGKEINKNGSVSISIPKVDKWDKWKRDIEDAQLCCAEMKKEK